MKCVQILAIVVVAASWTRIVAAQPPLSRHTGDLRKLDKNPTQPAGMGKDWRRFGSGLEDDHPLASVGRFSLEDDGPIASVIRFGSGLEDDAPARFVKVLYQPGF